MYAHKTLDDESNGLLLSDLSKQRNLRLNAKKFNLSLTVYNANALSFAIEILLFPL